jgi:fatty acid desaturase
VGMSQQGEVPAPAARKVRPMNEYAREIRGALPAHVFQPRPRRLWWLALHGGIIVGVSTVILAIAPPWYLALLGAVVIGHSWGCLGFLAHETLHHSVVKNRTIEHAVGYVGLLPYCLSPTLWVGWHNQTHHAYTGHLVADTDHFGTLSLWQRHRYLRWLERFAPGSGTLRSAGFLLVGFTLQAALVLLLKKQRKGVYRSVSHRAVYFETASMAAIWGIILALVGLRSFLFIALIPMAFANLLLMSYISTNHYLNPLTSTNDPLVNSLSVRNPRWIEALHLQFGYHVEHHIFPTMSPAHAREVRAQLIERYGNRYLSLPHIEALRLLYTRPKVHLTSDTLIAPRTGTVFRALVAGDLSMQRLDSTPDA